LKRRYHLAAIATACLATVAASSADLPYSPVGLLETHTLLTIYGRGFGIAPILGRLGTYRDFASMEAGTRELVSEIASFDGGKPVITGPELIYGLAVPCKGRGDCLDYLDGRENIVERYIKPAAEHNSVVILDTQLGRSDPATQIRHMIEKGYLKYDNVHVAIDPEFHVYAGREMPGTPIGTITASQVNEAQAILDDFVSRERLGTKKILIVHQFGDAAVHDGVPIMIARKQSLKRFPNVELVIDMDGLGSPFLKVKKYDRITSSRIYPQIEFRGIKIFYRSPLERNGHYDKPPMTMREVFGITPVPGGIRMDTRPDVVIIA
jgi:hypothetical protein